jgi:hypothetical protein
MTFLECSKARETGERVQLDGKGGYGVVVNLTRSGKVQVRYSDRGGNRVGVDPGRLTLVVKG